MNEVLYFPSNKKTSDLAKRIADQYNLKNCYNTCRNEQIYKNDSLLLCVKKKYIFLRSLSTGQNDDYIAIRKELTR